MLVLTRKQNEQITIGDDIKITLVRIRGNSVRIGIEAPRDVRVVRSELGNPKPSDRLELEYESQQLDSVFEHPGKKLAAPTANETTTHPKRPGSRVQPVAPDQPVTRDQSVASDQRGAFVQPEASVGLCADLQLKSEVRSQDGGNRVNEQPPRILYERIQTVSNTRQLRSAPLADFVSAT